MNNNEINNVNENEEMDNVIILNDEEGNEVRFEFLDLIEYNGTEYVVLLPMDDDDGMVVILQVEETEDGNESFGSVDDESVLSEVFEIFKDKFKDEFTFE